MHKITLALLASFLPVAASYADGMDALFLKQVYANGGDTLYCQESFQPGDRISVEQIYDERRLAQHFGCRSTRLCENNPQFSDIRKDRHALFPVTRRAEHRQAQSRLVQQDSLIAAAAANVDASEAEQRRIELDIKRITPLRQSGYASEEQLSNFRAQLEVARAQVSKAQAEIGRAHA